MTLDPAAHATGGFLTAILTRILTTILTAFLTTRSSRCRWVNFARAEHERFYHMPDGSTVICPKNCTADLEHAVNVTTSANHDDLATARGGGYWPTILGSYWEWVWGPVGDANPGTIFYPTYVRSLRVLLLMYLGLFFAGVGYMHRPSSSSRCEQPEK